MLILVQGFVSVRPIADRLDKNPVNLMGVILAGGEKTRAFHLAAQRFGRERMIEIIDGYLSSRTP